MNRRILACAETKLQALQEARTELHKDMAELECLIHECGKEITQAVFKPLEGGQ